MVVYCEDPETWDGDIRYNDDSLEEDSDPTPMAAKVQPLIETETAGEGVEKPTLLFPAE